MSVCRGLPCGGLGLFSSLALGRDLRTSESLSKSMALGLQGHASPSPILSVTQVKPHCVTTHTMWFVIAITSTQEKP